jgi:hypothetical protein
MQLLPIIEDVAAGFFDCYDRHALSASAAIETDQPAKSSADQDH